MTSLLTVKQAAERIQVSERTFQRYLSDKLLPVIRVGAIVEKTGLPRNVRIAEADLERFILYGPMRDGK